MTFLEKRLREKWRILGMKDFDYSFRAFLVWALRSGLLPEDLPIPVQEIVNAFNNRFELEIFFERAIKEGKLGPNPTLGDIQRCWDGLNEKQREHYRFKPSGVLIEELPRLRNDMAHPASCNLVTVPSVAIEHLRTPDRHRDKTLTDSRCPLERSAIIFPKYGVE